MAIPIRPQLKPFPKQYQALQKLWDKVTRFILYGGAAGGGKTWLGCEWLLLNCYRYPGSKWFLGRNELTRLMGSVFQTFRKACKYHDIPPEDWRFNGQYHYIEFRNPDTNEFDGSGSRIDFLDLKYLPRDPFFERFGSLEYTGGWIEEAGEVHFLAFDVLKSRIGRWMNEEFGLIPPKMLLTCNPTQNWLYRIFYKPYKQKMLPPDYAFIRALYTDNPVTAEIYGQQLATITDPILRARLKNGDWEYGDDTVLMKYDYILDLFTNSIEPEDRKFFSGDIAQYGSDKIVYGSWLDFDLYSIQWKQKQGLDVTTTDIRTLLSHEQIPYSHTILDNDGIGRGVVDNLHGVKGFVGNSPAMKRKDQKDNPKENYANLRSQAAYMLAEKVNNHQMAISAEIDEATKEMIIEELQALKRKIMPREAPLALIDKDDIKEALGRSPDFADMIMMRLYFDLEAPAGQFHMPESVGGVKPLYPGMPG